MNGAHFPANSRYYGTETAVYVAPDGRAIVYLRRRLVPHPETLAVFQEHVVAEGDRLDNVTAAYLGDPELFWRVADANRAMQPEALVAAIGRRLVIALPEGIPGTPNG
jgi:hypothetical protein